MVQKDTWSLAAQIPPECCKIVELIQNFPVSLLAARTPCAADQRNLFNPPIAISRGSKCLKCSCGVYFVFLFGFDFCFWFSSFVCLGFFYFGGVFWGGSFVWIFGFFFFWFFWAFFLLFFFLRRKKKEEKQKPNGIQGCFARSLCFCWGFHMHIIAVKILLLCPSVQFLLQTSG